MNSNEFRSNVNHMRPWPLYTNVFQLLRQPWFGHVKPSPQLSLRRLAHTLLECDKAFI